MGEGEGERGGLRKKGGERERRVEGARKKGERGVLYACVCVLSSQHNVSVHLVHLTHTHNADISTVNTHRKMAVLSRCARDCSSENSRLCSSS